MTKLSSSFSERARGMQNHNGQLGERMADWNCHYAQSMARSTLGQAVDSKTRLTSGIWGDTDSDK